MLAVNTEANNSLRLLVPAASSQKGGGWNFSKGRFLPPDSSYMAVLLPGRTFPLSLSQPSVYSPLTLRTRDQLWGTGATLATLKIEEFVSRTFFRKAGGGRPVP